MSLCLQLIILADDQARQNVKCKALVRRLICDFVGLVQQSLGTYIYRRVVKIFANSDMSQSSLLFSLRWMVRLSNFL